MVAQAKTKKDTTTTPKPIKQALDQADARAKEQLDVEREIENENLVRRVETTWLKDDVVAQAALVKKEKQMRGKAEEEKKWLEEGLQTLQEILKMDEGREGRVAAGTPKTQQDGRKRDRMAVQRAPITKRAG